MLTIEVVECKTCGLQYFAGDKNITLHAGNERQEPSELYFAILKVSKCMKCKRRATRTHGGKRRKR